MGLLDGPLADAIYKGFKGKLLVGVLRRAAPSQSGGLNDLGDPIAADVTDYPCQGFVDRYSAFYRANAGIPDSDLKACVFGKSLPVVPQKDDKVRFTRAGVVTWYQVRDVGVDPAGALYECQAFEIPEPT